MYDTKELENKMQKTLDSLDSELVVIRAGRANPEILNRITAEYYGVATPIPQMAQVSMPDARTLAIQPWDTTAVKLVERAILASDLGITPLSDGRVIRLTFQPPTEERRKELTKQVAKLGEEAKVAIRNIRREGNEKAQKAQKNGELTEDELKTAEKAIQTLTDSYVKKIDDRIGEKNKEIMSI
ncbi:MAG: ribosome recycling factor [Clostridia bacterium]|nr:ribosome recycling factor [Clostridia bacterium]